MKVFSGINDKLGIDMGSSQIRIYSDKKVILEEASCAALEVIVGKSWGLAQMPLYVVILLVKIAVLNGLLEMGLWWIMK